MNGYEEIMQEYEHHAYNLVTAATFGHLAPKAREIYHGTMLFTFTEWGNMELISSDFKGLKSNPWSFEDMNDYVGQQYDKGKLVEGNVYRFNGYYQKFKNGNYRFVGKLKTLRLV